ncbi:MAG: RNA methyltransferase [Patescibacteria group bacterium]
MAKTKEIVLILHNVRSAHNVGAIFRTAEAAGVNQIYLTGYTPAPLDRFDRPNKELAKTALGAEKILEWQSVEKINNLFNKLLASGFQLIALEQSKNSIKYKKVKLAGPTAIIVGNEVTGLSPAILKRCDVIAEIPMYGRKESLNVAVATGIFLFSPLK